MDFEESDILGGRLPVSPDGSWLWSELSTVGQISLAAGLVTLAVLGWQWFEPVYRQWREMRYRKAMRRKHGIPDTDNRPST
ncbi:hypothetical protein B0H21DRAFT_188283 [Amylocystis lapponica]|nr:hypothetical protein B0H21DRAFT_188283 [Amylocystis lapponica]